MSHPDLHLLCSLLDFAAHSDREQLCCCLLGMVKASLGLLLSDRAVEGYLEISKSCSWFGHQVRWGHLLKRWVLVCLDAEHSDNSDNVIGGQHWSSLSV